MNENALSVFNQTSEANALVGMAPKTDAEKREMANAVMGAEFRLGDFVNMELDIKNFYVEKTNFVNEDTGEIKDGFRTVLIDTEGHAYQSSSNGVANSLKTILNFFGMPDTWTHPLKVCVKQVQLGTNRTYTLQVL